MTKRELNTIIDEISFRDYWFEIMEKGDGFLLQVVFIGPDSVTGEIAPQKCRKWYVSSHACKGEVVRTALKAVQAAIEHETLEDFKYKGKAIFNPHLDPDELLTLNKQNVRD